MPIRSINRSATQECCSDQPTTFKAETATIEENRVFSGIIVFVNFVSVGGITQRYVDGYTCIATLSPCTEK
jgi:hypothetical protein